MKVNKPNTLIKINNPNNVKGTLKPELLMFKGDEKDKVTPRQDNKDVNDTKKVNGVDKKFNRMA